jgi:altronate dehydratase large subunit
MAMSGTTELQGYLRQDGRKGIRNYVAVCYLVECAHHVARAIANPFQERGVHLIGFGGCYPNAYAARMMKSLCTHPNVGGVLLVSLGCESFDRRSLEEAVRQSGRHVDTLIIQQTGGTRKTVEKGRSWIESTLAAMQSDVMTPMSVRELIVGTVCGGSDTTSGITANPAIGLAFDQLTAQDATAIFEETGELIGCEHIMARRALTPELADELVAVVEKAAKYYSTLGHGSFAPGNADGGLTTLEEKSMGAYSKSGSSKICGIIKPGDIPPRGGLYLLDVVPDGPVRFGFPNINDNAEIAELIACGSHLILFSTGRGSVVGSALSPVVKVCANPQTFRRMSDDMDINAGRILEGSATLNQLGDEVYEVTMATARGRQTASESLGHQEFVLTYKYFEAAGPSCLPLA